MQSTFLILMLALGLPGANSCNAQQQGLPRVGQTPPAPTTGDQKPVIADKEDADDDDADEDADTADMDDEDMDEVAAGPMAIEIPDIDIEIPDMDIEIPDIDTDAFEIESPEAPACDDTKASCQGSGSCQKKTDGQIGSTNASPHKWSVAQGEPVPGHVLHFKSGMKPLKLKGFTVKPGSTMVLPGQDGKPLMLQTDGIQGGLTMADSNGNPFLGSLISQAKASKQAQDDRVRELEKRVKELEAQLRARDEGAPRASGRSANPLGGERRARAEADDEEQHARVEADHARAMARDIKARVGAQSREYAEQARKQAESIRKMTEEVRKQAEKQAEQWRMKSKELARKHEANGEGGWTSVPAHEGFHVFTPHPPEAPEAMTAPVPPTPATPPARARGLKAPSVPVAPQMAETPRSDEMRAAMEQMRAQMEEMREQMKALREELQNAPHRELR